MNMKWMICAVMVAVVGCGNWMRTQARVGAMNSEPAAKGVVDQVGGRDVLNVSPTVAVSGGGGLVLAIGAVMAMRRRGRK
jgi:hypothetical protein